MPPNMIGPRGPRGVAGPKGPYGPPGPEGPPGTSGLHATTHQPGGSDAMAVDAAAATGSLRTIGTGALTACAGNDARLTNARTPTAHATTHQPGGSDAMAVDAAAATGSLRTLGAGAAQACAGNDARLSDARAPTAHGHPVGDISGLAAVATSGSASDLGAGTLPIARIADDAVTYAKIQNVTATDKVLGRSTAGAGDVEEIACTAAGRALIDDVDASAQRTTLGLGALATKATVATGDIDADAVTYAKIQNVSATDKVLGRSTAGAGDVEEITCTAAGRALIDDVDAAAQRTTLGLAAVAASGSASDLGAGTLPIARIADGAVTLAKLADLAAARILGRNTGAGVPEALTTAQATALLDAATAVLKGLVPTPPNNTTTFLRGDATWAAPVAGPQPYALGTMTIPTGQYLMMSKRAILTGAQRLTVQGNGRLRVT